MAKAKKTEKDAEVKKVAEAKDAVKAVKPTVEKEESVNVPESSDGLISTKCEIPKF